MKHDSPLPPYPAIAPRARRRKLTDEVATLTVACRETKPSVSLDHRRITLTVRPGTGPSRRAEVIHEWHKSLLHAAVPPLIKK